MTQTVDTAPPTEGGEARPEDDTHGEALPAVEGAQPRPRRSRIDIQPAHLLVALVVGFNLWYLRAQRLVVVYPNDSAFHSQMVAAATRMLSHGQNPLASWFPNLSLGSPLFVQYQGTSAILTGAVGLVVGPQQAYAWSLYLLLALWPLCVYWTGRLLRWGRWESALAAVIAPLLASPHGRGFEFAAYVWQGSGLWSQLWAMWGIALAVGFGWRYLSERQYLFGAVAAFSATIALHYLLAYLTALILIVMVLLKPSDLLRRVGRAALVGGCAALATLWVTVPLLKEAGWTSINQFQVGTPIENSYGAPRILTWLVHGQLFDFGHFPIITVLVVIGFGVCLERSRRDERARVLVAIFTLSMLLYFGPPTLGFALDHLPDKQALLFQRFITGVDLAAVFLAGVGAVFVARAAISGVSRLRPTEVERVRANRRWHLVGMVAVVAIVIGALTPAWSQARWYLNGSAAWIGVQQDADAKLGTQVSALLAIANRRDDGRVYDGLPQQFGGNTFIGGVQLYNYVESTNTDAVGITGRTFSLMSNPEAWFDQDNPGDYATYGIHYILGPADLRPLIHVKLLARTADYKLWVIGPSGYFRVIDTRGTIAANAADIGNRTSAFLASNAAERDIYPTIAFDGSHPAPATLPAGVSPRTPPGRVVAQRVDLTQGSAVAVVHTSRRSVVLLSASYDPGWSVTVDGAPAKTQMIAPALLGVAVGPGTHRVAFVYHGYGEYPLLFAIGILTLVGVAVVPILLRRRRSTSRTEATEATV